MWHHSDHHIVKRAEKNELKRVFAKYSSVKQDGERFMTLRDFVCDFLQILDYDNPNEETLRRLGTMADTTQDELISFVEFRSFESMLCAPDGVSLLAFKIFDLDNNGKISFNNFKKVLSATTLCKVVSFDFDCTFVKQYFGYDKSHQLDYNEFSQLLQNLPTEHARQAFRLRDTDKTGTIPAFEFVDLMTQIRGFRMSEHVQDNLLAVAGGSAGRRVSYPYFKAINQMLSNLDLFRDIMNNACDASPTGQITRIQLTRYCQRYPQITPLQVSLLFDLCSLDQPTGTIGMEEFRKLLPWEHNVVVHHDHKVDTPESVTSSSWSMKGFGWGVVEQVYRFVLGGIAGGAGATAVYPIDLVKTRLQNQRGSLAGEIMYKNSFDCFAKVIRYEGFFGLYRGLLPQLVGVSPEKAIKLTVNDFMRDRLRLKDGSLPVYRECIAGGCGGMSQVMFTNPLEIVKIRLQVAGEMASEAGKVSAVNVVRELGFFGLYKGASACLLRDIPFSAIYFTVYANMKTFTADENGYNRPSSLFASAMTAGVPAAYLCTPADVIKTRLQVKGRAGQDTYTGIVDCFKKILKKEGGRAFWKGGPARVFRSAPQFGVTLLTYEMLQRFFYVDFGKGPQPQPSSSLPPSSPTLSSSYSFPDHIGGYRLAHSTFSRVESRYGLLFPKAGPRPPAPPPSQDTPQVLSPEVAS